MPPDADDDLTRLDDIIRRIARAESAEHGIEPEVLGAYVADRATPDQVKRVQAALDRSSELREELVYIARLFSRDLQAQFDLAIVPRPGIRPEANGLDAERRIDPRRQPAVPWWERGRTQVFIGLAASIVAALLLFGPWTSTRSPERPSWKHVATLDPSQLREIVLRDGAPPPSLNAQDEAAMVRSRIRAALSRGESMDSITAAHPEAAAVRLRVGDRPLTYAGAVPFGSQPEALWVLAMPSRRLHRGALPSGNAVVGWPDETDSDGLVILSYRLGKHFGASRLTPDER